MRRQMTLQSGKTLAIDAEVVMATVITEFGSTKSVPLKPRDRYIKVIATIDDVYAGNVALFDDPEIYRGIQVAGRLGKGFIAAGSDVHIFVRSIYADLLGSPEWLEAQADDYAECARQAAEDRVYAVGQQDLCPYCHGYCDGDCQL